MIRMQIASSPMNSSVFFLRHRKSSDSRSELFYVYIAVCIISILYFGINKHGVCDVGKFRVTAGLLLFWLRKRESIMFLISIRIYVL